MFGITWDFLQKIFMISGGLGLFLYGMKMMSDGLEKLAGNSMRTILEKATSNRFLGIIVGAIVTCIIQSSSATTVMVVGFVNANMMSLMQAVGVIMGANIGTTITAQIISFKIDQIAPLIIFIGVVINFFAKKRNTKNIGYILLGFGILFFGISVMGGPLKDFSKIPEFQSMLSTFHNPILALLVGLVFTAIIQSSSATTGIIVSMYLGGVSLPFQTAAFLILGSNIGTCITAILASISTSRESKRAALVHVLFNVIGGICFGVLIIIFPQILLWIQNTWPEGARQVAMFHTIFNISTVILLVAFIKPLTNIVYKIIPVLANEDINAKRLLYLGGNVKKNPAIAVTQAQRELCRMGQMTYNNLQSSLDAFYNGDFSKAETVIETEKTINYLNHEITIWLIRIRGLDLSDQDLEKTGMMLRTVSNIERIDDHVENIAEYALLEGTYGTQFSKEALKELHTLSKETEKILELALTIFENRDESRLLEVEKMEQKIDKLVATYIENHIQRLKDEKCDPRGGVVFTALLADLEACSDYATDIAYSILNENDWHASRKELQKVKTNSVKKNKNAINY